ncbi:MAG: two-component regulator propeller domain-containing protein [Candidatus Aminicenantes bacterium]|jgi:ligand-binding sensor domain-containing protein/signal transduction histidine kinase
MFFFFHPMTNDSPLKLLPPLEKSFSFLYNPGMNKRQTKSGFLYFLWLKVCIFLSFTSCLNAQGDNIRFKRISKEQGLSQVTVNCILQDSKGFLWFGTQEGLNRYDGYEFKSYKHDPEDSTTISDSYIWCITEDKSGILWIGTNDGGLNSFNRATEKFTSYKHDKNNKNSLSHNYVKSICEDHEEFLWIGTFGGGLNKFDIETKSFTLYQHDPDKTNSLSSNNVNSIIKDRFDTIWIGTDGGLNQYDPRTDGFIKIEDKPNNLIYNNIKCIIEDRSGEIWIGTQEGGMYKSDRKTGNFEHVPIKNENGFNHNSISCLFEDSLGKIWIGTEGAGLYILDKETGKLSHATHNPGIPHSLSNDVVNSIYEDKSGIVWVGTYSGGLNKYNPRSNKFALYQQYPGVENSLSSSDIRAVYEDRDGTLWIGTRSGGLNIVTKEPGNIIPFTAKVELPNEDVRCICEDKSGILWIGTRGSGLYKFDRKNEKFKHYIHKPDDPESLSNNSIRAIYEDKSGDLWIGTEGGGLNKLTDRNEGHFQIYKHDKKKDKSLSNDIVFSIFEDSDGFLWVGTRVGGLNKFDPKTKKFTNYTTDNSNLNHNFVLSIYEDQKKKNLWVGTYGGGLNKMNREKGTFTAYRKKDGLPNDVIYGILEDKQGNLWLSTNNGISKFNVETRTFHNYDKDDGLQSNSFNSGSYFKNSQGKMFFGGINGLNSFFPEEINPNHFVPPVVITDFFIFNESVNPQWKSPGSPLEKVIHEMKEITLSHEQNSFSFEFAALDYTSPKKNQYQYILKGSKDKEWKPTDPETRRATFINIPPGEYTFMVKGSNSDGKWNDNTTSIDIKILTPWWETLWAYALYFLAFIGLAYLLRTAWYKRFLIQKVEERTKELKNIQSQLVQSEKMAGLGLLVAGVAHEINNPSSFVHTSAYNLKKDIEKLKTFLIELAGDDADKEILDAFDEKFNVLFNHLASIKEGTSRISKTVSDLSTFSRLEKEEMKPIKLLEGLKITLNLVKTQYKDKVDFVTDFQSDSEIEGIAAELNQVFMNLLVNACHAILEKQKITGEEIMGTLIIKTMQEKEHAVIRFQDTGVGMSEEVKQKMFDPFFTTRTVGEGIGLGLFISYEIIRKHKGRFEVESMEDKGTTVTIYLPLTEKKNTK